MYECDKETTFWRWEQPTAFIVYNRKCAKPIAHQKCRTVKIKYY